MLKFITAEENHLNLILEDLIVVSYFNVLQNSLEEPPTGISAVITWVISFIKQIRNQAMTLNRSKL